MGWVGQSGPVCNVDLWIKLLALVDEVSPILRWLRVPSHTDIEGNEKADALAKEGIISSPIYHVLSLPDRPVINLELSFTPTPRRAPAVPRSLDINDFITSSRDTPALRPYWARLTVPTLPQITRPSRLSSFAFPRMTPQKDHNRRHVTAQGPALRTQPARSARSVYMTLI